jgi:hypothetical protein
MRCVASQIRLIWLFYSQRIGSNHSARLLQRSPRLFLRRFAPQFGQLRFSLIVGMTGFVFLTGLGFKPPQRVGRNTRWLRPRTLSACRAAACTVFEPDYSGGLRTLRADLSYHRLSPPLPPRDTEALARLLNE